jgi:hypothetical protein
MSYILDALKKVERERGISQVPTLATVHDLQSMVHIRRWAIPALFVLCAAVILWSVLFLLRSNKEPVTLRTGESSLPAGQSAVKEIEPLPANTVPAAIPQRDSPAAVKPAAPRKTQAQEMRVGAISAASPTEAVERHLRPAAKAPESTQEVAGVGSLEEKNPVAGAAREKPMSLREAMAKMTMTIHLFSDAKAERLVFINGKKYVEGDYVEGDYLLESITPEGAVLSYGGERATLRPGAK